MEEDDMYEFNKERLDEQYFIDREGKSHKFKGDLHGEYVSIHYEIANALYPNVPDSDDYLMKLGWVMMGSSAYTQPVIHIKPSQAQINVLGELGKLERLGVLENGYYEKFRRDE